ncbi:MAG: metallophosphoesterase, partial [Paludibacter sp.]
DSSFYIVGRDDKSNLNRKKLSEIVTGLDKKLPFILMDHQPYHLEEAEQNDIDFQISGHTHNGQFFPGNLFVKKMYELGYGYLKKGNTHYYVSSGLGLWGPQYRIGTESELVVINLKY